ncbi:PIH1 domain-containing protein 1-like [Corticium candelabrum]|uniref:PIH1 domain-containing protein 1-like n=1 Tax=Corticium candelabrum TaxID=121492 RepID=UPI002E269DC2|nr:PIH1 domain-containing protein 1-like [Corticium candelabrum]
MQTSELRHLSIAPEPAYCLKTKTEHEEKIFINVSTSNQLPAPKDISAEELAEIVALEDPTRYRVPLSIGPPHAEIDKSGKGCTVYDIIVHPLFYEKTETDPIFMSFFVTIMFDGLEQKYSLALDRKFTRLKRKKAMGCLTEQFVRTSRKPLIMEMKNEEETCVEESVAREPETYANEEHNSDPQPDFVIYREPGTGKPDFIVLEVKLPGVHSSKYVTLDIGEDCVVLKTTGRAKFYLDVDLTYYVIISDARAQFNRKTKVRCSCSSSHCLSVSLRVCQLACLSACLLACLSVCLSVCQYIYFSYLN